MHIQHTRAAERPPRPDPRPALAIVLLAVSALPGPAHAASSAAPDDEAYSAPFETAIRHMNDGEYDAAVIHLKNILQDDVDDIPARILLGRAYLRQGFGNAAEKELRNAWWRGADEKHILVPLGNALLLQRKYEEILRDIKSETPGFTGGFEVLTIRGRASYELDRLDDAERDFDRAIELAPDAVNPLLGRALVSGARGQWDEAMSFVSRVLDRSPANAEAWYQRAEILRATGDHDDAMNSYGRALEYKPAHKRARIGRASLALHLGDVDTAYADASYVNEHSEMNITSAFILWQTLLRQGRTDEAREAFRKAADRLTMVTDEALKEQPSLLRIAGLIALAKEDFERANYFLSRLIIQNPHDNSIRRLLAEVQIRLGDNETAARDLFMLSKKFPEDVEILALLGEAYMNMRHFGEASAVLERAIALTPDDENVRTQLALSRIGMGETDAAIAQLKDRLNLGSATTSAGILLATLQVKRGDVADALATVRKLDALQPDNPVVLNLLGTVLLAVPDRASAALAFQKATEIQPDFIPALYNLAQMSLDAGDLAAASKGFEKVLKIDTQSTPALIGLADVSIAGNNLDAARRALEKLISTDDSNPKAFVRLIQLHLDSGNLADASRTAERFLQRHIDTMDAFEMMAETKSALGKRDDAVLYYRRAKRAARFDGDDLLRLARGQVRIRDFEGARSTLTKAMNTERSEGARAALVRLDVLLGNLDTAMSRALEVRDRNPDEALGHVLTGEVLLAERRFDEAIASYRTAVEAEAGAETIVGLTNALFSAGRREESIEVMNAWIREHPDNPYVEREYALRLILMRRLDEAQAILERLSKIAPNDPLTLTTLARCYQLSDHPGARGVAEQAYALRPDWSVSADTLGWILVMEGEAAEGLELLREAFARDKNPLTRFHIASALSELGRRDEARRELEAILEIDENGALPWIADVRALYESTR